MVTLMESPSPSVSLNEGYSRSVMMSSPSLSPSSDGRFLRALRSRFNTLLDPLNAEEMGRKRRLKEEAKLLLRGFDSMAQSLSLVSGNLENSPQAKPQLLNSGVGDFTRPSTFTEILHVSVALEKPITEDDHEVDKRGLKRKLDSGGCTENEEFGDREKQEEDYSPKAPYGLKRLKKAKNLETSMVTKMADGELKSDLGIMQERCALLEEENSCLRKGLLLSKGIIQLEEDDLVRLQLEALLAEKSRLANENANLARENQWLHQLVEYHQKMISSQEQEGPPLSASYYDNGIIQKSQDERGMLG